MIIPKTNPAASSAVLDKVAEAYTKRTGIQNPSASELAQVAPGFGLAWLNYKPEEGGNGGGGNGGNGGGEGGGGEGGSGEGAGSASIGSWDNAGWDKYINYLEQYFNKQQAMYDEWNKTVDDAFSKYENFMSEERINEILEPSYTQLDKKNEEVKAKMTQAVLSKNLDSRYLEEVALPEQDKQNETVKRSMKSPLLEWKAQAEANMPLYKAQAKANLYGSQASAYSNWMNTGLDSIKAAIDSQLTARGQDINYSLGLLTNATNNRELDLKSPLWEAQTWYQYQVPELERYKADSRADASVDSAIWSSVLNFLL